MSEARWIGLMLLAASLGCTDPVAGTDGGQDAGGPSDAGAMDAATDASALDAGWEDAGLLDAGNPDAGNPDAGSLDAGTLDAGALDAGSDAGEPPLCPPATAATRTLHEPSDVSYSGNVVWTGTGYAAVWIANRDEIWFASLAEDGVPDMASVHRVFSGETPEVHPRLAMGAGELGLSYQLGNTPDSADRTYFARLSLTGVPIGSSTVLEEGSLSDSGPSAIAYGPARSEWAVAWVGVQEIGPARFERVRVSRLDGTGALLHTSSGLETLSQSRFRALGPSILVWTGDRFAVAIEEFDSLPGSQLTVVELDNATGVPSHRVVMDTVDASFSRLLTSLASDGSHYVLAWEEVTTSAEPKYATIRAANVGGSALGSPTVFDTVMGSDAYAILLPSEAGFVGVWSRSPSAGLWETVRAEFMADGTPVPMSEEQLFTNTLTPRLRVASDGCADLVLWDNISFDTHTVSVTLSPR